VILQIIGAMKKNYRILLSSLINFLIKNLTVFIAIDVQGLNPKKSYIYILVFTLAISFFSNLKIGFGLKIRLSYISKWLFVMITLLIIENYVFIYFENNFDVKVILSSSLSLGFYIFRFLLQKNYIFK